MRRDPHRFLFGLASMSSAYLPPSDNLNESALVQPYNFTQVDCRAVQGLVDWADLPHAIPIAILDQPILSLLATASN